MEKRNKNVRVLLLNPAPSLITYGMYWGFKHIGCDTILLQGDDRIYDKPQEYQLRKIEDTIKKQKTNLLFCEGYSGMPVPEIKTLCKKYSVQFHFWDIETPVTPAISRYLLPQCDFMWTTCIEYMHKFREQGYKSDLLLFGCCLDIGYGLPEERFKHDISIVGMNYDNRWRKVKEFILPLIENNYDLRIYGGWWMSPTQPFNLLKYPQFYWSDKEERLPFEWLPIVVNSSKIMVGLNCSDQSETQTSCRPYETLNCAYSSVYLAWYTPAQNNIFKDYIYQAKTGDDMLLMADEILSMTDSQREEIATKAREYVRANHHYGLRAQQVVDKLYELGGV